MQIYSQELSKENLEKILNSNYESDALDFKETFDIKNVNKSYLEILKDIVAFANTEGGYIVFGVEDDTFKKVGVNEDIIISSTKLNKLMENYVDEHIKYVVSSFYQHDLKFIVIFVEKLDKKKPAIFKKDGAYLLNNKDKFAFKVSTVYIRKGTESENNLSYWYELKGLSYEEIKFPKYGYVDNLPKPNYGENFVGRDTDLKILLDGILKEEHTYRILIHGIGGLGKTALAQRMAYLLKDMVKSNEIELDYIFWISAKTEEYNLSNGIKEIERYFNDIDDVLNGLKELFEINILEENEDDKVNYLINYLKNKSGVLIIDNWETVKDENNKLLDFLLRLPGRNKIIITSRYKIVDQQFKNLSPSPMIEEEGKQFLKKWISNFNDEKMNNLSDEILFELSDAAGGIPIAMIMAIGQMSLGKPIREIIKDLKEFEIDDPLLEFCFRETYKRLSELEQKILLSLTFFSIPVKKQLITSMVELSSREVTNGLLNLIKYSFIDVLLIEDESDRKENIEGYKINPITKSFLKQQLISVPHLNEILQDNYHILSAEMEQLDKIEISSMLSVVEKLPYVTYEDKLAASFAAAATKVWKSTKDWESASKKFDKAKVISPNLGYIYGQWAWVCENAGKKDLARENYHKAIQLDEDNIKLWYQWAMFELLKGDYEEAESKFSTVLNKKPDDSRSWHGLARVKYKNHENGINQNLNDLIELFKRGFIYKDKFNYSDKKHNSVNAFYLAKLYLEKEEYFSANKFVEEGLKYMPNDDYLKTLKDKIKHVQKNKGVNLPNKNQNEKIKNGTIIKILNYGAFIKGEDNETYFLHISKIGKEYIRDINERLIVGQNISFTVVPSAKKGKYAEASLTF